jgi:hypothetical protein
MGSYLMPPPQLSGCVTSRSKPHCLHLYIAGHNPLILWSDVQRKVLAFHFVASWSVLSEQSRMERGGDILAV